MEKMVKTETAEITMGIGKEKRTFGFIKDSFKNMQGGMLADSSFLKNIFYFSKYEKDMINDETIEFMRARGVCDSCPSHDAGGRFFVDVEAGRPESRPNALEITKETTLMEVRWTRFMKTVARRRTTVSC